MNVTDEAIQAADRSRRYHRMERTFIICAVIVVAVAGIFWSVALARQNEIRRVSHQQVCIARLTAAALAAPPGTQSRDDAAAKLMHLDSECRS